MSGARAYLLSDTPHSRLQSRLGQSYRRWLAFRANPLALVGLAVPAGMAVALALDATIVRVLLLPATMRWLDARISRAAASCPGLSSIP